MAVYSQVTASATRSIKSAGCYHFRPWRHALGPRLPIELLHELVRLLQARIVLIPQLVYVLGALLLLLVLSEKSLWVAVVLLLEKDGAFSTLD